ncbi:penicillin-binding protein 2 [Patescibacteria group bacterium]|nr:penicillin-binding protein 2 [Patescibacteria group bacterium]
MKQPLQITRIHILFAVVILISSAIVLRLFFLQVIHHGYYKAIAQREQQGYTTLPSRRGEILIDDYHSGDVYKLATNTTLDMIYADPTLIDDPDLLASTLAPLLFDLEIERELDDKRLEEEEKTISEIENEELRKEAEDKLKPKTDEELAADFEANLRDILARKTRDVILIAEDLDELTLQELKDLKLEGLEVSDGGNLYAFPSKISNKSATAKRLAEVFGTDADGLESTLLGKNRYVILKHKLEPEISKQIETILEEDRQLEEPKFLGIRLKEEYFRFYPEGELAAQVLGYVNSAGDGQYGMEGTFNDILKGKDGIFTSQLDAYGKQITVGTSIIEEAQDGADITLTIDRAIQLQVERYLAQGVEEYQADSGQVIVMNPKTGAILAMAQYPTFNPNTYGDVFEKEEITLSEEDKEKNFFIRGTEEEPIYWLYLHKDPDVRIQLFPDANAPEKYFGYINKVGPEVYKNKMVQEVYEPGSVFKPLVMGAAVDSDEVTANTTFVDSGPLQVDEYEIHTFDDTYHGIETMTQVLQHSCNTGMAWVAMKMGRNLMYSYLKNYGFTERTGITINDEVTGTLEYYDYWADSELVTKAFGQGISVTPLQLIQAYTTLANGGIMMQPQIIKQIEYPDGSVETFEPQIVRQVLEKESAETITAMMVATAESYLSLALDNHYFAGKSGTAQTYKWGKALKGRGTTIGSFVGFGPIDDPIFIVLVKLDRPRTVEWGASTAGFIYKNIATYLFDYYNIPPDKE